MRSVYQTITKPENCAFVLGLPAGRDDYYKSRGKSDYATRHGWLDYQSNFLDDFRILRSELIHHGVHLVEYASINDFAELWKHEYHAVVLFSHWNKNGIDFQEGTVPIDKVVESIPVKTLAILDLCVCHPQNLVDRLCVTHLSLLTKSIWQEAEPREWCMFYGALFNLLRHKEYSYPDGVDQIAKEFMRKHYKGRNSQNERKSQKDN